MQKLENEMRSFVVAVCEQRRTDSADIGPVSLNVVAANFFVVACHLLNSCLRRLVGMLYDEAVSEQQARWEDELAKGLHEKAFSQVTHVVRQYSGDSAITKRLRALLSVDLE